MEILRDACRAPSGDNTQPWRFLVRGNVIYVINVPERDTSLFNYRQMTNYVALGACLENLRVSAESRGFRVDMKLFPNAVDRLSIAEAILSPRSSIQNELAPYIKERATNRRRYLPRKIEQGKFNELSALAQDIGGRIVFITDDAAIKEMASIVSAGEKLVLEDRAIHDFLFKHVTWTKKEDEQKHGLLIDTFEFTPPQKAAFRLFSNWHVLKLFLPFGVSKMVAKDMERVHTTAAAFGAIIMPSRSDQDYLKTGILLERLWLTVSKLGLALQPTTTVNFIGTRVLLGDPGTLSEPHQKLLRSRYAELAQRFGVAGEEGIGFVFRLGYAGAPSSTTTRFEPEVSFEDWPSASEESRLE